MHNRSIHSTNYHCQCFPNYQNRQNFQMQILKIPHM